MILIFIAILIDYISAKYMSLSLKECMCECVVSPNKSKGVGNEWKRERMRTADPKCILVDRSDAPSCTNMITKAQKTSSDPSRAQRKPTGRDRAEGPSHFSALSAFTMQLCSAVPGGPVQSGGRWPRCWMCSGEGGINCCCPGCWPSGNPSWVQCHESEPLLCSNLKCYLEIHLNLQEIVLK